MGRHDLNPVNQKNSSQPEGKNILIYYERLKKTTWF
jgi:hypothetical protein